MSNSVGRQAPTVSALFDPLSAEDFFERYWGQKPLLSTQCTWLHEVPFDQTRFSDRLSAFQKMRAHFVVGGRARDMPVDPHRARNYYEAGMTICVGNVERHVPQLHEFASKCKEELNFAGYVLLNCYWSPQGGGLSTHFDAQHVFILQLDGEKKWWVSERPACEAPPENLGYEPQALCDFKRRHPSLNVDPPDEQKGQTHVLKVGDSLYLPPGTWHRTEAGVSSLSLTLTLRYFRFHDLILNIVGRHFDGVGSWRSVLPLRLEGDEVPELWTRTLNQRLEEFRRFASSVTSESLLAEWISATRNNGPPPAVKGQDVITDDDLLRRQHDLHLWFVPGKEDEGVVLLLWDGGRFEVPIRYRAFCESLAAASSFTAREAHGWTEVEQPARMDAVRELLRRSLEAGLVARV